MTLQAQYSVDLPIAVQHKLLKQIFAPLKAAQEMYEKCEEVDAEELAYFATVTLRSASIPTPTEDEIALLKRSLAYRNIEGKQYKRIRGSLEKYPTVSMFARPDTEAGDGLLWGKVYGDVDDTAELVLGWFWRWCSYARVKRHREREGGNLLRVTDASDKSRTQVVKIEYKMARGIQNRRSTLINSWFRVESENPVLGIGFYYVLAFDAVPDSSTDSEEFSASSVRATSFGMLSFETVAPRITKVTLVQKADLGGGIPKWLTNSLVDSALNTVVTAQELFRRTDRIVDKVRQPSVAVVLALWALFLLGLQQTLNHFTIHVFAP